MGSSRSYGADKEEHMDWLSKQDDYNLYNKQLVELTHFRDNILSGKKDDFDKAEAIIRILKITIEDMEYV